MWNPLAQYIKAHPRAIKDSWMGKLTDKLIRLQPSKYDTTKYPQRLQKVKNRPIRIVFSGMHDNQGVKYAQEALKKRYGQNTIYVFGYDQYQDALRFAQTLDKDRPITVYGYSWGGGDAQRFLNEYKGNVVGAHFMDPVRKDLDQKRVMSIPKRIPTTFTKALPFTPGLLNDVKQATIGNLRYIPSKNFKLLPIASSHGSVDQWVKKVYNYQKANKGLKKAAFLGDYIRNHAVDIQKSGLGKLILRIANALPADYNTKGYSNQLIAQDTKNGEERPIRIFFSGLPDSSMVNFAKKAMEKKYGPGSVFVFGHKQLPEALQFAASLDPNRPVTVYGFSWGSTAAKDFANLYKGNIKGVHFLDPMRKAPSVSPQLRISRKVPVTFTPASTAQRGPVDSAVLDVLRWKPAQNFKILPSVRDHLSIDDWLQQLPKAANYKGNNMTYKQVLRKIAAEEDPYAGMNEKQKNKYIKKRIKAVPKRLPYQDLTPEQRLAYMLRQLKKARLKSTWYAAPGFQMTQRRNFQQLDPETYSKLMQQTAGTL